MLFGSVLKEFLGVGGGVTRSGGGNTGELVELDKSLTIFGSLVVSLPFRIIIIYCGFGADASLLFNTDSHTILQKAMSKWTGYKRIFYIGFFNFCLFV